MSTDQFHKYQKLKLQHSINGMFTSALVALTMTICCGSVVWGQSASSDTAASMRNGANKITPENPKITQQINTSEANGYTLTLLEPLHGMENSKAAAINTAGDVVGVSSTGENDQATLWHGLKAKKLNALPGDKYSQATGINSSGDIVGISYFIEVSGVRGSQHGVLWHQSTITPLGTLPKANGGVPSAINDAGRVVGNSYFPRVFDQTGFSQTISQATLWNGTMAKSLYTLDGTNSRAEGINNKGVVAGYSVFTSEQGYHHATLWNGASTTELATPPGNNSRAITINNGGQVVGTIGGVEDLTIVNNIGRGETGRATLWDGAKTIYLGGKGSIPHAINDVGQIVGDSEPSAAGWSHATLWDGADAIDLNKFLPRELEWNGWVLTSATGINDRGWIVGYARQGTLVRAFVLMPDVPTGSR